MPNVKDMLRVIKGGKQAEKIEEAGKVFKASEAMAESVVKAQSVLDANAPVRVRHPFNKKEVFQFPPGTSEKDAKEMIRNILLKRAREGEEKIEFPSELPKERVKELETKEKELEKLQGLVKDLESRKDLSKVGPGLYQDDNTGKYWRVTENGRIEEATIGSPPFNAEDQINKLKVESTVGKEEEAWLSFYETASKEGLSFEQAEELFKKTFKEPPKE